MQEHPFFWTVFNFSSDKDIAKFNIVQFNIVQFNIVQFNIVQFC